MAAVAASEPSPELPGWQTRGRVLVGGVDNGGGVAVAPRLVLTARHVLGAVPEGTPVTFRTAAGDPVPVEPPIGLADGVDAAVLRLARDVAWSQVATAKAGDPWSADPTGVSNDPLLTGTVTATALPITDATKNRVVVMQLDVDQNLGGFKGYSGNAVFNGEGYVTGLLFEQKPERVSAEWRKASNVLFALPIADVAERLGIWVSFAQPAEGPPTKNVKGEATLVGPANRLGPGSQPAAATPTLPAELTQGQPPLARSLPAPASLVGYRRIFGRGAQIRSVAVLLQRGDRRLVTLWGPPGVGKSRLSIAIAAQLAAVFGDRIWRVQLEVVPAGSEAGTVVRHLLEMLGMPDEQPDRELYELSRLLGQQPGLLILDNCEHILTAVAQLTQRLLGTAGGLRVLTTTRRPLGLEIEREVEVRPLALDDAVRLFIDLAWEGRTPDAGVQGICADICSKVDRIPLAIRLAAARIRDGYAVAEVRDGLDRSLRVLVDSGRQGDPRHQAMETALDWSYGLLDENGQRMLRAASVFAAPFDQKAAGHVFGESKTGMNSRTDVALRTLQRSALMQAENGRLSLLETVRQYGEKKLRQCHEDASAAERFARYYLQLAEAAAEHVHDPEAFAWLARLDANREHLRKALTILAKSPQDRELHLRLAVALADFWRKRGYLEWGSQELRQALAAHAASGRPRTLALVAAGKIATRQGDLAAARDFLDGALTIAVTLGDVELEAAAGQAMGALRYDAREYAAARPGLLRALDAARAAGSRSLEQAVLRDLGQVDRCLGDPSGARRHFDDSLAIAEELGDAYEKAALLISIGHISKDDRDYGEARKAFEAAQLALTEAQEPYAVAVIRLTIAQVAVHERRYEEARARLDAAMAEATQMGARGVVAWAHYLAGWLEETRANDALLELSDEQWTAALTAALGDYEEAARIDLDLGAGLRAAENLESAGWVASQLSDQEKALACFDLAAAYYRQADRQADAERLESQLSLPAAEPAAALPPPPEDLLRIEALLEPGGARDRELVREAIQSTWVYALGEPIPGDGEAPSSDLLHFSIDRDGAEVTMLPIFTRDEAIRIVLHRYPEWQIYSVLKVKGSELLDNIGPDVKVVVNPWTAAEFEL
jgi:predicted ATPase